MDVYVHGSPDDVALAVAARMTNAITTEQNRFNIGLAGGSTPAATYRLIAENESVDWSRVDLWLSDERWVPHDDTRSNGRMVIESLGVKPSSSLLRPPFGPYFSPGDSAAHYESTLRELFVGERPDLILLGLGDDGHTASLFVGTTALLETRRLFTANHVPQQNEDRLTATFPLLWRAQAIIFMVAGESKATAVKETFEGSTPASRVGEGDGRVEWHLDQAAASLL